MINAVNYKFKSKIGSLMKSAVFSAPGIISFETVPKPIPGPGEVLIKLEGCGVCASNLPVWEGREWFSYPFKPGAPGHEGWGWIDAVGEDVSDLKPGYRVAAISYNAFSEYDLASSENVIPLPKSLDGVLFPGEPLGCAVNVVRRSGINSGDTVAVVGAGFLGILLIALAKKRGAKVIALSRRNFALEIARKYRADETFFLEGSDTINKIMEMTTGIGCDVVIEAAGHQNALDLASEITRERGRLVIAGYHQDGTRKVNMQLWNWKGIDVVNAHERDPRICREGISQAMKIVEEGSIDLIPLFTHITSLERLAGSFELLRDRPDGFIKALVTI